jgi:hypothetical protein
VQCTLLQPFIISKSFVVRSIRSLLTTQIHFCRSWRSIGWSTSNSNSHHLTSFFVTFSEATIFKMKHTILALTLIGAAAARPASVLKKREVPQEHSHRNIVNAVNAQLFLDNPDDIQDAIFGLLGAAAAADGAGQIADPDCLQQATADQAFTNAKAAGDVDGMTNALIFRALERSRQIPCPNCMRRTLTL